MSFNEQRSSMLHGILLIALFACAAFYIGEIRVLRELSISPMIIGIVLGMIYANSLRNNLPATWVPGIVFCSKKILRLGIIFYGFRLTLGDIAEVGLAGITVDAIIVITTILGGVFIGKLLKMDGETALLTSVGSGICGADRYARIGILQRPQARNAPHQGGQRRPLQAHPQRQIPVHGGGRLLGPGGADHRGGRDHRPQ